MVPFLSLFRCMALWAWVVVLPNLASFNHRPAAVEGVAVVAAVVAVDVAEDVHPVVIAEVWEVVEAVAEVGAAAGVEAAVEVVAEVEVVVEAGVVVEVEVAERRKL